MLHALSANKLDKRMTTSTPNHVRLLHPNCATVHTDSHACTNCRAHTNDVQHVSWAPDGSALVSAGIDNESVLWDSATSRAVVRLEGHRHYVQVYPLLSLQCIHLGTSLSCMCACAGGPPSLCAAGLRSRRVVHCSVITSG